MHRPHIRFCLIPYLQPASFILRLCRCHASSNLLGSSCRVYLSINSFGAYEGGFIFRMEVSGCQNILGVLRAALKVCLAEGVILMSPAKGIWLSRSYPNFVLAEAQRQTPKPQTLHPHL